MSAPSAAAEAPDPLDRAAAPSGQDDPSGQGVLPGPDGPAGQDGSSARDASSGHSGPPVRDAPVQDGPAEQCGPSQPHTHPRPAAARPRRSAATLPLLVVLVFAALQTVAHPVWTLSNDSYRYARQSLEFLGVPPAEARSRAVAAYCASDAARLARIRRLDPAASGPADAARRADLRSCLRANAAGLSPTDPRYERIFTTRPGYPLLISPAVALLGVARGMWLTGLLLTAGSSLLVVALLRQAGASPTAATAGQLLFLCCRLGWWSTQPLAEGAVTTGVLAALLGGWWLLHGRTRAGAALLLGALAATTAVKYPTALMLACALAAAAVCRLLGRAARPRPGAGTRTGTRTGTDTAADTAAGTRSGAVLLAALAGSAAALIAVGTTALRLPDAAETLQDTFTRSFHRPPVADVWQRLLRLDAHYGEQWLRDQAAQPLLPALLCLAGWALARRCRTLGVLAAAAAAVGAATAAAHPVAAQQDRLWALLWVPAVLGAPFALDLLRPVPRAEPASSAAVPAAPQGSGAVAAFRR
ncbi:hypothetical protein LO771_11955 [Streptacidiphilus sp. ASG 303]|uniref:hypothetical protein n=1 Tax=Streptacidiphilus sp. ASG 303 TaxID=2896847 RepID=UPI001E34EE38|nr:hypothetical protein [Streptacidiphilus sp. ASG 303]MCD0483098.1 hypothetical protein [Streptacidiphilus sp. ASG 303]